MFGAVSAVQGFTRAAGGAGPPPGARGYPIAPPPAGSGGPPGPKPITGSPQTMAEHALTLDPRTGLPRGEKPPASISATISLICGVLLCLGPLTGVSAVIAGFIARDAARARPLEVGGSELALAGICLGIANLVLSACLVVYLLLFVR